MRVLGIDPGFDRLGLAIIEGTASKPVHIWSACVEPDAGRSEERLAAVAQAVDSAIKTYAPNILAIETLFFSKNRKTALTVGQARGTILSRAGVAGLRVIEFSPQQVKLAVTGYGAADKKAVAQMLPKLLALPSKKRRDDECDAIAVAITALAYPFHNEDLQEKTTFAQI
jgi:crossover junction endodeoxyribonuclease RuvC